MDAGKRGPNFDGRLKALTIKEHENHTMRYAQAQQGRIFVIRLEDGEIVHEQIERFASEQGIHSAALIIVGGANHGSTLVVGPENGVARPVTPMEYRLPDVHEVAGVGTLFPDEKGTPVLHMHMACGRNNTTTTGCVRTGVRVWEVMEAILIELINTSGKRVFDPATGFKLLQP